MNSKNLLLIASAFSAVGGALHAGERASANYSIPADTTDAGGARVTSANYTNDGSVGGIVGVSTVASPAETAKHGYLGQLYDVIGLTLSAASLNVNETATDQLAAWQVLDDLSVLAVPAASVAWTVDSTPITGISASGLVTAGIVYENSAASVQGSFGGFTASLGLTVLDSLADNFGAYAGDAIGDDWQVQYFGFSNPNASPLLDPDGDGDTNLYEYHARLIPTDPASFLNITLIPGPNAGQGVAAGQAKLTLAPGKVGTTYTLEYKNSLLDANWTTLTAIVGAEGSLPFTDPAAAATRKFYRVRPMRMP